jgi:hypothetical protein
MIKEMDRQQWFLQDMNDIMVVCHDDDHNKDHKYHGLISHEKR